MAKDKGLKKKGKEEKVQLLTTYSHESNNHPSGAELLQYLERKGELRYKYFRLILVIILIAFVLVFLTYKNPELCKDLIKSFGVPASIVYGGSNILANTKELLVNLLTGLKK